MTPTERTILETVIAACRAALGEDQATPEPTLMAIYDLGFRDGRDTSDIADFFSVAGNPNRQAYIREVVGHTGRRTAWEGAFSPDGPWHRFNEAAAVPDKEFLVAETIREAAGVARAYDAIEEFRAKRIPRLGGAGWERVLAGHIADAIERMANA